jgi:hypothetical protein
MPDIFLAILDFVSMLTFTSYDGQHLRIGRRSGYIPVAVFEFALRWLSKLLILNKMIMQ